MLYGYVQTGIQQPETARSLVGVERSGAHGVDARGRD